MVLSESLEMVGVELKQTWMKSRKVSMEILSNPGSPIQLMHGNQVNLWTLQEDPGH